MDHKALQAQREDAYRAAYFCRNTLGMSVDAFVEAIDLNEINPEECQLALLELKKRGELDHLIEWIWKPINR